MARQLGRKAQDWWTLDEDGIQTVPILKKIQHAKTRESFSSARNNDNNDSRMYRVRPVVQSPMSSYLYSDPTETAIAASKRHESRNNSNNSSHQPPSSSSPPPPTSLQKRAPGRPYAALPGDAAFSNRGIDDEDDLDQTYRPRCKRRPRPPVQLRPRRDFDSLKRIFSPYNHVDDFGSMDDEYDQQQKNNSNHNSNERPGPAQTNGNGNSSNKYRPATTTPSHLKDRFEERLDSMLGIRENGEVYNRWVERDCNDENNVVGDDEEYDAFALAQGRRQHSKKRGRQSGYHPLRSDVASRNYLGGVGGYYGGILTSILFGGRSRPPKSSMARPSCADRARNYDSSSRHSSPSPSSSSPLTDIRNCVGDSLLTIPSDLGRAGNSLCQWASVRGAVPQPLVALSVVTAAVCGRQSRIWAMVLALSALRTIGELVTNAQRGLWYDSYYDEGEEQGGKVGSFYGGRPTEAIN
jgi:hypothetical protein